ncbi:MAG: flagellar biosynthesis protein FlhB [Limnohabitans sp.]
MSDSDSSEKTEAPTGRKLQKARNEGQVARSVEMPAAAVTIAATAVIIWLGGWLVHRLSQLFMQGMSFDRKALDTPTLMPSIFAAQLTEAMFLLLPVLAVTVVAAIAASGLTGGFLFSWANLEPKAEKLSMIAGFKRMFGAHAAMELFKGIAKFSLVALVLWIQLNSHLEELLHLSTMSLEPALYLTGKLIGESALWLTLTLGLIALLDAPYQKYAFIKRMRMTKQEVKDELKDMEGRPEVKAQIRRKQREMSNARMMQQVKDADVVITNPEHFAVALAYDPTADGAPILLAKGADQMAARIREEARAHGVEIFEAAPLARALYFTTELDQPVPESLYYAVAQVIAYVFSLGQIRPGVAPMQRPHPEVPPGMRFNPDGKRVDAGR